MRQRNPDVANDFILVSQQLHLFKLLLLQRSKKKIMNFLINKNFCPPVAILFFLFRLFRLLLQFFSVDFLCEAQHMFLTLLKETPLCVTVPNEFDIMS